MRAPIFSDDIRPERTRAGTHTHIVAGWWWHGDTERTLKHRPRIASSLKDQKPLTAFRLPVRKDIIGSVRCRLKRIQMHPLGSDSTTANHYTCPHAVHNTSTPMPKLMPKPARTRPHPRTHMHREHECTGDTVLLALHGHTRVASARWAHARQRQRHGHAVLP